MMWGSNIALTPVIAAVTGALFGVFLVQILLHPLRTNRKSGIIWDILLAMLLVIGSLPQYSETLNVAAFLLLILSFICPLVLFAVASPFLIALIASLRSIENLGSNDKPFQFSLADLLAVMIAIGFSPLLLPRLGFPQTVETYAVAFVLIVFLYIRAFDRLHFNQIKNGLPRSAFLVCYPYLVFGCIYLASSYFVKSATDGKKQLNRSYDLTTELLFYVPVALGTCLAWMLNGSNIPAEPKFFPNSNKRSNSNRP